MSLILSVIICTYNRAHLLEQTLEALVNQTVPKEDYEVIIINDGSNDATKEVVDVYKTRMALKYFYQDNTGPAGARNQGIHLSAGEIIIFLDDDLKPTPRFIKEHLKSHRQFPDPRIGILGHIEWAPNLTITPLMDFIAGEGGLLLSYNQMPEDSYLNYQYFWVGASSCKRKFLLDHGLFNQAFKFGIEDTELGFRLSKHGFRMVYKEKASSHMTRPVGFEDFCRRSDLLGHGSFICSQLHPEPEVQAWCMMEGINQKWLRIKDSFDHLMEYACQLDQIANDLTENHLPLSPPFKKALYQAYGEAFEACKIKGIMEERNVQGISPAPCRELTFLLDPVKNPFKVVAIICAFNEGDIIYQVIKHLVENGVLVYLLNHHSTDNTLEQASRWLGKGLLHIELFPDESDISSEYEKVFALRKITERVEQLHLELGADWYLHYDADEFRESPWPGMTLQEAIRLVDTLGFNAINFECLNFWPTEDNYIPGKDVRDFIQFYEPAPLIDKPQIKAWKNFGQKIDLAGMMGHKVSFDGLKVCPLSFILRHYRIRSQAHGLRKIFQERVSRFDPREIAGGFHLHYNDIEKDSVFIKNQNDLIRYQPGEVRKRINFKAAFNASMFK